MAVGKNGNSLELK